MGVLEADLATVITELCKIVTGFTLIIFQRGSIKYLNKVLFDNYE